MLSIPIVQLRSEHRSNHCRWGDLYSSSETLTSPRAVVEHPKADFIKLHFKSLNLPQGSAIRLTSRDGTEVVQYTESQQSWFAQSLFGDQVLIELIPNAKGEIGQFEIDYYMAGNESLAESELLSTCGINERKDVACWQDSHPEKSLGRAQ